MHDEQTRLRVAIYRGGTSKGIFLLESDLPLQADVRDRLILALFGSPDLRQIDGLGGADSLTSKVAIIRPADRPGTDLYYTFGQVSLVAPRIDYSGNCGNISSAVGPFAIDEGLITAKEPVTTVRILNTNTKRTIVAQVPVVNGKAAVKGNCAIHGVPGSGAPIVMDFPGCEGAVTGKLLPTGQERECIWLGNGDCVWVSIVDAANPCVFARASDLNIDGTIVPQQINGDAVLLARLDEIRARAAERLGLVDDWADATTQIPGVPKMILVSESASYVTAEGSVVDGSQIDLVARALSMQKAHKAYPVTGTICTAVAAQIRGTLVNEVMGDRLSPEIRIGHPAGVIQARVCLDRSEKEPRVQHAEVLRTARRLLVGYAFIPTEKM